MTVKDRVGRVRHVAFAFHVDGRATRRALSDALRDAAGAAGAPDPGAWHLTVIERGRALVRVPHTDAARAREAIAGIREVGGRPARLEPLGTSGTIRAARRKWLSE